MDGIRRILNERARQTAKHGYSEEHDDLHSGGELAMMAACYAAPVTIYTVTALANGFSIEEPFPFESHFDKRQFIDGGNVLQNNRDLPVSSRIRLLEKAGALIAAEIDRLLRMQAKG